MCVHSHHSRRYDTVARRDRREVQNGIFDRVVTQESELFAVVREAERFALSHTKEAYSFDVIEIDIRGVHVPNLNVVDVPGMTRRQNISNEIAMRQLQKGNQVILAAVPCTSEVGMRANALIGFINRNSSSQNQVIGVLTQSDRLPEPAVRQVRALLRDGIRHPKEENSAYNYTPWYMVQCGPVGRGDTGYGPEPPPAQVCEDAERLFLQNTHPWRTGDQQHACGLAKLRQAISRVLDHKLRAALPALRRVITETLTEGDLRLQQLGPDQEGSNTRSLYKLLTKFHSNLKQQVVGTSYDQQEDSSVWRRDSKMSSSSFIARIKSLQETFQEEIGEFQPNFETYRDVWEPREDSRALLDYREADKLEIRRTLHQQDRLGPGDERELEHKRRELELKRRDAQRERQRAETLKLQNERFQKHQPYQPRDEMVDYRYDDSANYDDFKRVRNGDRVRRQRQDRPRDRRGRTAERHMPRPDQIRNAWPTNDVDLYMASEIPAGSCFSRVCQRLKEIRNENVTYMRVKPFLAPLLRELVSEWRTPVRRCLDNARNVLFEIISLLVETEFHHYRNLEIFVRKQCQIFVQRQWEEAQKLLGSFFELEESSLEDTQIGLWQKTDRREDILRAWEDGRVSDNAAAATIVESVRGRYVASTERLTQLMNMTINHKLLLATVTAIEEELMPSLLDGAIESSNGLSLERLFEENREQDRRRRDLKKDREILEKAALMLDEIEASDQDLNVRSNAMKTQCWT